MKNDMINAIRQVATFTGYHLTEYKILKLDDLLYIDNFRKSMVESHSGDKERQEGMKKHIRKGQVGDWKNYFTEETNKVWDEWISKNLEGTDILFPNGAL